MKKEVDIVNAVPSKRLFLSIIADYNLNRSICELVDNAIDIWIKSEKKSSIEIKVDLDLNQQTIFISDNSGGVKKSDLHLIVGPGQTSNLSADETIGIFGVGTKRAVVALAQDIKITTRYKRNKTYSVEFDDKWLKNEEWELPVYEVDEISESTTIVELQKLRMKLTEESFNQLEEHLQATYARFIRDQNVTIRLNSEELQPLEFDNWAYPPDYSPRNYIGNLYTEDGGTVKVEVLAGLSLESSPAGGEYGVYFYCNDRLIARSLKSYDVGFAKGLAGQPHPDISLTKVIVSLHGKSQLMPWNSSKSGIYPNHNTFIALRNFLVTVVKDYSSLSRRFVGEWPEKVFKYTKGEIVKQSIDNFPEVKTSYLPPLPKTKLRYSDKINKANRNIAKNKPWVIGLYEGIISVDTIFKQKLEQKNRICLIILDSTLEIAIKEYLVNESGQSYNDKKLLDLFRNRTNVQNEINKYVKFSANMWKKINYYYTLRNKLIHERATIGITDGQIEDYREVVQKVLKRLFKLSFKNNNID